ncbi:MAG: hypothetical protein IPK71_32430 [Myxococcales bacterium]|nr:hypothetical protein [Myxococcales bacterium]
MSTRHKPRDPFEDDEHGTAKRDYPPGFVEARGDQATARIPREDLDRLLRRESGTRPKVSISASSDPEPREPDEPAKALESGTHLRPGATPRDARPLTKPTPLAVVVPEDRATRDGAGERPTERAGERGEALDDLAPMAPPPSLERRAIVWTLAAIVGLAALLSALAWVASHTKR